jgi:hypothetical protein
LPARERGASIAAMGDEAPKTGLFAKLNSPFVITFIGGALITFSTQMFLRTSAAAERERAREQAIFEKKVAVATSYANDIETASQLAGTVKKKRLWLAANTAPEARDDLGRTRATIEAQFWEAWKLEVQARKFSSVITEVLTLFKSQAVLKSARELVNAFNAEQASRNDEELEQRDEVVVKLEGELARAMSDEIWSVSR